MTCQTNLVCDQRCGYALSPKPRTSEANNNLASTMSNSFCLIKTSWSDHEAWFDRIKILATSAVCPRGIDNLHILTKVSSEVWMMGKACLSTNSRRKLRTASSFYMWLPNNFPLQLHGGRKTQLGWMRLNENTMVRNCIWTFLLSGDSSFPTVENVSKIHPGPSPLANDLS